MPPNIIISLGPREKCSPSDARAGYVFPTFYQCSVAAVNTERCMSSG